MVSMKGAISHTTPFFLAGFRLLPAGVLILMVSIILKRPQPNSWRAWGWIILFSIVDGTCFQGFLTTGLSRTGAGIGSVMIDSQPLAVAILALWIYGERIGLWGWLGLCLGIVGISVLGFPQDWLLNLGSWFATQVSQWTLGRGNLVEEFIALPKNGESIFQNGQGLMILAALSMAGGTVMIRTICRYVDPVVATGWHMVFGGLPLFILSWVFESNQWTGLTPSDWFALGYATTFGSAVAYGLFFYFASRGSLTSLSSLTFLTPIFALLFGNLILGEVLNPLQCLGVSLTLISIFFINQRDRIALWIQGRQTHGYGNWFNYLLHYVFNKQPPVTSLKNSNPA
jgi:drug/metabolite transporter (DMT)-like permease